MKRIFITGGHLAPALAVISELQKQGHWEIYYIGRQYSMEGSQEVSVEFTTFQNNSTIKFLAITTGRLQRSFTRYTLPSLFKIPLGIVQSLYWVIRYRPHVILSFGSYVGVPVSLAGFLLGVPVITHEQTLVSGLANRLIAKVSKKILVSWPDSLAHFSKSQALYTGNPVRQEIFAVHKTAAYQKYQQVKAKNKHLPTLYITGGNQGALSINKVLAAALPRLVRKYLVIHSQGQGNHLKNWHSPDNPHYFPFAYIPPEDIGWVYDTSDIVISRAGANTISEIAALGKVALLIPLPWSGGNEQQKNAQMLNNVGSTQIMIQEKLTPQSLADKVDDMVENFVTLDSAAENLKQVIKPNSAALIAQEVTKLASN